MIPVLCALLAALAPAPQSAMMPIGLTGKFLMLHMEQVKKELKVTKEQDKAVAKLFETVSKDPSSMGMSMDMHYMTRSLDAMIAPLLDEAQNKRLQELFLQYNGLLAVTEKEVVTALGLSEEVQAKATAIVKKHDRDAMTTLMETRKTHKVDTKHLKEIDEMAKADLTALLTAEQNEKWKTLVGAPFTFPKMGG